ncbi:MAG: hypothetical protein AMXMBFR53_36340 [Gemmatimonadota bacterium]
MDRAPSLRTPFQRPAGADGDPDEPLEGELARFFGYSHDVLVILDRWGRVLVVSPSVERVLGYPLQELIGERLFHRVHPEDQHLVRAQARHLLAGHVVPDLHARILRADGGWVPMRWSLSPGPGRRVYGVGRDWSAEADHREARLNQEMAELRLRTAMELHDGILQMLTGASFQIAVARRLIREDPEAAEGVLEALGKGVSAEQQEMRLYVDEVKGRSLAWRSGRLQMADRVSEMLERVGVIWGLQASSRVSVPSDLSVETGRQVLRIIQEAAVNAVRHGGARSVSVSATVEGREIVIRVDDDGHGFSFLGDYDAAALKEKRLGPLSLKHRVAAAGGQIAIRSTPTGSSVSVRLPRSSSDAL